MSDALTYLVKARPEAMGAYFKFLKGAGAHLDPKTRNLISVITKVHAQTENGLRQYLTRALREGASADEILDALLMAFPALGLAKIVWAIDVILGMDLPAFRLDRTEVVPCWHDVAPMTAVKIRQDLLLRLRRPQPVRVQKGRRPQGLRQPLPAPSHEHPAPCTGWHKADMPEACMGIRHRDRALHRERRPATHGIPAQGREEAAAGVLVAESRSRRPLTHVKRPLLPRCKLVQSRRSAGKQRVLAPARQGAPS